MPFKETCWVASRKKATFTKHLHHMLTAATSLYRQRVRQVSYKDFTSILTAWGCYDWNFPPSDTFSRVFSLNKLNICTIPTSSLNFEQANNESSLSRKGKPTPKCRQIRWTNLPSGSLMNLFLNRRKFITQFVHSPRDFPSLCNINFNLLIGVEVWGAGSEKKVFVRNKWEIDFCLLSENQSTSFNWLTNVVENDSHCSHWSNFTIFRFPNFTIFASSKTFLLEMEKFLRKSLG